VHTPHVVQIHYYPHTTPTPLINIDAMTNTSNMPANVTKVFKDTNGQFKVTVPAAIGEGMSLDGAHVRWEFVHGRELKVRVTERADE